MTEQLNRTELSKGSLNGSYKAVPFLDMKIASFSISRVIGYYTVFTSQRSAVFSMSFQKIVDANLWPWMGLRKSMK